MTSKLNRLIGQDVDPLYKDILLQYLSIAEDNQKHRDLGHEDFKQDTIEQIKAGTLFLQKDQNQSYRVVLCMVRAHSLVQPCLNSGLMELSDMARARLFNRLESDVFMKQDDQEIYQALTANISLWENEKFVGIMRFYLSLVLDVRQHFKQTHKTLGPGALRRRMKHALENMTNEDSNQMSFNTLYLMAQGDR
jgi:hypothetical protein